MKAYGALGVCLIVLGFLGYVGTTVVLAGSALVLLDAYTSHNFYKDIENAKNGILTISTLLMFNTYNEEDNDFLEDE